MQLADIELDDDFEWVNEFTHNPIEQTREHSITGALLIQEAPKLHGRLIELSSNGGVWTPLSVVRQLEALRDQAGQAMPLQLPDGRDFHVTWDRTRPPLEAVPLHRETYPAPDSLYLVTLRLITVAPPPEPAPEPNPEP